MNDNTAKLLEQLAAKLGTTSQYLWGILLKQAHISAITTLVQILITLLGGLMLYRVHKKLSKEDENVDRGRSLYWKYEELAVIPMIISSLVFIGFLISAFFSFGDVINGFFSPEYWALEKVLDTVK